MRQLKDLYKGKKILVTGGGGFIGSHLVEKLIECEAKVTVLDNLSTGTLNNLQKVITQINLIYGDIRAFYTCLKATKNIDFVFHLAAFISVPCSIKNPMICNQINVEGTKNLLKASQQNNVKTFILSSSAAVYGNKNDACQEDHQPNPQSPYAASKLEGEKLCQEFSLKYDINTACLRYFNVYGERQNAQSQYASVVAKFKENLLKEKPLVIFGDGKQSRDFIHVSKVVEANIKIGMQKKLSGEIFNIATGKSISLLNLIDRLEKETSTKKTKILYKEAQPGDILTSKANCSKYNKLKSPS